MPLKSYNSYIEIDLTRFALLFDLLSAIFEKKLMSRKLTLVFLMLCSYGSGFAQDKYDSPYEIDWTTDGTWVGIGLGLNAVGLKLIQEKQGLTAEELRQVSREDVWKIDRWVAGNYSENADHLSDYPFYGSFAVPFLMLLSEDFRPHAGEISVMFLESMATTGALYSLSAGLVKRKRPLVYNESLPDHLRREFGVRRSFFGGHVAATATATFFAAKIYHDFNSESFSRYYVWTAAALVPAWVGYLRTKAGKHFFTDNLVGYGVGALSGILIPELHKKDKENFVLIPTLSTNFKGLSMRYKF